MRINGKLSFWVAVATLLAAGIAGAQTGKPTVDQASKLEGMLKEFKASYQPVKGEKAFFVSYSGDEMKDIKLFVIEVGEGLAVLVDVATADEVNLTPAIMRRLLEYTCEVDYIKVGISKDGAVRVQTEQSLYGMKSKTLEEVLNQIAAGANDVAKILAPVRKKQAGK